MVNIVACTPENLIKAILSLKKGRPVSFPTDTVYALAVPINHPSGVQKIFDIKRRPLNLALPVLIGKAQDIDLVAYDISDTARHLMHNFWPGALTLVFKKKPFVPSIVTGGQSTVGVRVAKHNLVNEIIKSLGVPVVGTSANIHGQPSPTSAQEVAQQLGNRVKLIFDDEKTNGNVESTIIDMSTSIPRILRQGAVSRKAIEKICHVL